MEQSQKVTARRYLKLLRWLLTGIALWCALSLIPGLTVLYHTMAPLSQDVAVIGGRDGPTTILVGTPEPMLPPWFSFLVQAGVLIVCLVLAVKVGRTERRLR